MLTIKPVPAARERSDLCKDILDGLPDWFGRPDAIDAYAAAAAKLETFTCRNEADEIGIACLSQSTSRSFDLHLIAVRQKFHRQGAGRLLVEACVKSARDNGAEYLTVQTVGPSQADPNYAPTRCFYEACGFAGLMEFAGYWERQTPMLLMVRRIV